MIKVWLTLGVAVVFSAGLAAQAPAPLDEAGIAAARAGIQAERDAQNAVFDAQDDACLARFAVTDCQNEVAKRRRAALAVLKRQEVELNDAVRQQRAQEQVQRTREKMDARAQEDASKAAAATDRASTSEEKQRAHPQPITSPERRAKPVPRVDASVLAERRRAYADKQQALLKKRQERDKRLQEQSSPQKTLPTPP